MTLSLGAKRDADRGIELGLKVDLALMQMHKDAAALIKSNNYDELHSKFNWKTNVSAIISQVSVGDTEEMRVAAIKKACSEYQVKIATLICGLEKTFYTTNEEYEMISIALKYMGSIYEDDFFSYVDANDVYDTKFDYYYTNKEGVLPVALKLQYLSNKVPSEIIEAEFDNAALESWMTEHTLVQSGHLVFVE